jgi:hypothetical protein
MKILLGDFNAKVGSEDTFKPRIGSMNLHEISNDNGVRLVNFATSKNLTMKSTMFPHHNNNLLGHNQIDHILIDRRQQSSVLGIQSFRASDCNVLLYRMTTGRESLSPGRYLKPGCFEYTISENQLTTKLCNFSSNFELVSRLISSAYKVG